MFPLAFILKPEFRETLQNVFGRKFGIDAPEWVREESEEEMVELWEAPKDAFKAFYSGMVGPRAPRVY